MFWVWGIRFGGLVGRRVSALGILVSNARTSSAWACPVALFRLQAGERCVIATVAVVRISSSTAAAAAQTCSSSSTS